MFKKLFSLEDRLEIVTIINWVTNNLKKDAKRKKKFKSKISLSDTKKKETAKEKKKSENCGGKLI